MIATNSLLVYREQPCRGLAADIITLAATYNTQFETGTVNGDGTKEWTYDDVPTQIQICPWFIDWIKSKEFKTGNDAMRSNIGRAIIKTVESKNFGLRQIGQFIRIFPIAIAY
jgi:hypothetical protein